MRVYLADGSIQQKYVWEGTMLKIIMKITYSHVGCTAFPAAVSGVNNRGSLYVLQRG